MGVKVREKVLGSGIWWVFVAHNKKRTSRKVGNKKAALNLKKEIEEELAKGSMGFLEESPATLAEYGRQHIESPIHEWGPRTTSTYLSHLEKHIIPYPLSQLPITEVRARHIKEWIGKLKGTGLAKATIQLILAVLSGIFEAARVDEIISANPCQRAGKFIGNGTVDGIVPFTAEEVQEILDKAVGVCGSMDRALFTLLARTGIRIGEALGLEWDDINFEARTATISKNWDSKLKRIGKPKNKKTREVDLSPGTVAALGVVKQLHGEEYTGPIFVDKKGDRLKYDLVARHFEQIRPREIGLHGLRHTYATLRIAKGDNIVDVSNQLGHHDPGFTLKRYAHWVPRAHKSQVDELDTLHLMHPPCTLPSENPAATLQ